MRYRGSTDVSGDRKDDGFRSFTENIRRKKRKFYLLFKAIFGIIIGLESALHTQVDFTPCAARLVQGMKPVEVKTKTKEIYKNGSSFYEAAS